jgi:hypothetical protein
MWLMTPIGFFSLSRQGDHIAVRARRRDHLEALLDRFPNLRAGDEPPYIPPHILATLKADYPYRVMADREKLASAVYTMILQMDWSNFKAEAERVGGRNSYTDALHRVWQVMLTTEEEEEEEEETKPKRRRRLFR